MHMPDPPSKKRWDAKNTFIMTVKFMRRTDEDVIEFLDGKNRRETLCEVIRFYMANHKED